MRSRPCGLTSIRKRADYVTTRVDEDGVYNAYEALGLLEPVDE